MYYVNKEQLVKRLEFIPTLIQGMEQLQQQWNLDNTLHVLAQERLLHLSIETVTDIGSYMIDGFIMRDASSYEDIIEVNYGEQVFDANVQEVLLELVKLRKPLVQQYFEWDRSTLHPMITRLPQALDDFSKQVYSYLESNDI